MKLWRRNIVLVALISTASLTQAWSHNRDSCKRSLSLPRSPSNEDEIGDGLPPQAPNARRSFVLTLASSGMLLLHAPPAFAGEIGRRITEAVTTSELGQSVRQSVVRGAQIMDQLDAQSERFSDRFHLGSARSQRDPRPRPREFPALLPLDAPLATHMLEASDRVFCQSAQITPQQLQTQIQLVRETVLPSFVRAGLELPSDPGSIQSAPQFNFAAYVHYKAYADLLASSRRGNRESFAAFIKTFERQLGEQLVALFERPASTTFSNASEALSDALQRIDALATRWVQAGLVSQVEPSPIPADLLEDWLLQIADLSWSVALDLDITINAQVLLQEQGLRLYPSFLRCMIRAILEDALQPFQQTISMEDYYFDTDYNSDPNQFEVKQVLVNVNIENAI